MGSFLVSQRGGTRGDVVGASSAARASWCAAATVMVAQGMSAAVQWRGRKIRD